MANEIRLRVKTSLKSAGYVFSDEWYDACYEWALGEFPGSATNVQKLQEEVYGQWIDADLQVMETKSFPPNLAQERSTLLKGKFCIQINSVLNVANPAYEQLNKIRKTDMENAAVDADADTQIKASWEPKPRRCLRLMITDGTQKLKGFELAPIPHIDETLLPGTKAMISGAILCRKGVLFLKPGNIRIIGGSVESLLETNSIVKQLEQQINKGPGRNTGRANVPNQQRQRPAAARRNQANNRVPAVDVGVGIAANAIDDQVGVDSDDPFGDDEDEAFLMDFDDEQLTRSSPTIATERVAVAVSRVRRKSVEVVEVDPEPAVTLDFHDAPTLPIPSQSVASAALIHNAVTQRIIPQQPFLFISYINKKLKDGNSNSRNSNAVSVKACVATLVSNVKPINERWTLAVNINDGTGHLEADVDENLLNRLIGFTPTVLKQLRAKKTQEATSRVNAGLRKLTSTLLHMNGIFTLKIVKARPVILSYETLTANHHRQLEERLSTIVS